MAAQEEGVMDPFYLLLSGLSVWISALVGGFLIGYGVRGMADEK